MKRIQVKSESRLKSEVQFADRSCGDLAGCEKPIQILLNESYENGTEIAKLLKDVITIDRVQNKRSKAESNVIAGQMILKLLELIKASAEKKVLSLEGTIVMISRLLPQISEAQCELLKSAIATSQIRDQICSDL